jgi:hypothetical protein
MINNRTFTNEFGTGLYFKFCIPCNVIRYDSVCPVCNILIDTSFHDTSIGNLGTIVHNLDETITVSYVVGGSLFKHTITQIFTKEDWKKRFPDSSPKQRHKCPKCSENVTDLEKHLQTKHLDYWLKQQPINDNQ